MFLNFNDTGRSICFVCVLSVSCVASPVCFLSRVTLAFTGVGLLVFLTSIIGLLPNGRYRSNKTVQFPLSSQP